MNLDDREQFQRLDPQDMLSHIDTLPDQLANAWDLGMRLNLPQMAGIQKVVVAGMGGSAIGADLLSSFAVDRSPVPVIVHRDYSLPGWARGPQTLVIASSHSGNTEETLSAFDQALENQCQILAISTGGELAERARAKNVTLWTFEHKGQPRTAVGFSFGLLAAALNRLGLLNGVEEDFRVAVAAMRDQQKKLQADVPVAQNPAKRQAGQFMGRYVTVLGSGYLAPVARRWKTQINELAKAWAQFEFLPEADHNMLEGIQYPEELLSKMTLMFLQGSSDHPRNALRGDLTRQIAMTEGISTDFYRAKGNTPMEQIWTALHFGDYVAYYLAIAYGVDPTPVETLQGLKRSMKG